MKTLSTVKSFGGIQGVYSHASSCTNTEMSFSVFVPPHKAGAKLPVLWYLSGLTCTHANVTEKGEFRRACAENGIIFIAPDTSPRGPDLNGDNVADDPDGAYDFGLGAGFYVNASEAPFAAHYQMRDYIEKELPTLIAAQFPAADMSRQGITGHSMGGHGALTIGLRNPDVFKSISAFAPIVSPMDCPWGEKALKGYIGTDKALWREYDACALIEDGARAAHILVDQGAADNFLDEQLKPHLFTAVCKASGQAVSLRLQAGYDHSYYFVSSFMAEHVAWHAQHLTA
jgi:S-formylglutathione hydrolase